MAFRELEDIHQDGVWSCRKTTDGLVSKAKEISEMPNKREYDVLLSTGEQITISLLAMVLQKMGKKEISFTGWQIPIITDENYSNAKIK